jgi:hypothetical protein
MLIYPSSLFSFVDTFLAADGPDFLEDVNPKARAAIVAKAQPFLPLTATGPPGDLLDPLMSEIILRFRTDIWPR